MKWKGDQVIVMRGRIVRRLNGVGAPGCVCSGNLDMQYRDTWLSSISFQYTTNIQYAKGDHSQDIVLGDYLNFER